MKRLGELLRRAVIPALASASIGLGGSLQVRGPGDAADSNVSGVVDDGSVPGFTADVDAFLDDTVLDLGVTIDAIVVKGGSGYNRYGPEDAPFVDLRSPLVGAGTTDIPTIGHWFACYRASGT